ncbi:serine/threonine protein kinase [Iningainema sp. BLCCT55]|uniref:non-specific serine/threonine protein kinase n=2 Tax=Iningainema TaxID=1932705 RepID=A0A8J6XD07_9CYAN|nr:serine/threonine protein kinase [Iningainema tapete BLCC-T55]
MREPVPDVVAQKFLQRFLEAFTGERSVCLAVRRAREKIHALEPKFPGVTWLPIVFQNPAEPPLTGREFRRIATGVESTQVYPSTEAENQSQILWLPTRLSNSPQPQSPTVVNPPPKPITCSKGHPNPTNNKYCVYCGESLGITAPSLLPPTSVTKVEKQNSAATPIPTQLSTGSVIGGRYKIIQPLGRGGFSQTYLAEDTQRPGTPKCVVKQLHLIENDPSACQIARRLFATEAQVLEQLGTHDYIPRLLAYLEENHKFYLVQELIEGQDLSLEIIPGKQMSESYVLFLLRDVLEILEFVHQQNVIHRDIKPSNLIRRQQDGKLVLIDFGAVKEISNQTLNSQRQSMTVAVGTSGYLPPEQMYGKPQFSSDIYALGMLCIEAITGMRPYQLQPDPNTNEIRWRERAQVGSQLAIILDKMVCYDFKERYQSATEVLWDLKASILPKTIKKVCSSPSLPSKPNKQINFKLYAIARVFRLIGDKFI